jgi:hypothetical protein
LIFNFSLECAMRKVQENQEWWKLNRTYQLMICAYVINSVGENKE